MPFTATTGWSEVEAKNQSPVPNAIDDCIRQRLANCPYAYYFNRITWRFDRGRLTLSGCVPTFYMKQMLQEKLRGIELVEQIVNNVDVVSSTGLSSTRPR